MSVEYDEEEHFITINHPEKGEVRINFQEGNHFIIIDFKGSKDPEYEKMCARKFRNILKAPMAARLASEDFMTSVGKELYYGSPAEVRIYIDDEDKKTALLAGVFECLDKAGHLEPGDKKELQNAIGLTLEEREAVAGMYRFTGPIIAAQTAGYVGDEKPGSQGKYKRSKPSPPAPAAR